MLLNKQSREFLHTYVNTRDPDEIPDRFIDPRFIGARGGKKEKKEREREKEKSDRTRIFQRDE